MNIKFEKGDITEEGGLKFVPEGFKYKGIQCCIMRITCEVSSILPPWFNGYVMIEKGHPWHGILYHNVPAECEGLTFAARMRWRKKDELEDWYIGFDTSSLHDKTTRPEMIERIKALVEEVIGAYKVDNIKIQKK